MKVKELRELRVLIIMGQKDYEKGHGRLRACEVN